MAQTKTKKPHPPANIREQPTSLSVKNRFTEGDSVYFLKLVIVVMLGTLWLKFKLPMTWYGIPLGGFPLGLLIGLAGIKILEKNIVDRKIWYAVLVIVTIICYFVPAGIII